MGTTWCYIFGVFVFSIECKRERKIDGSERQTQVFAQMKIYFLLSLLVFLLSLVHNVCKVKLYKNESNLEMAMANTNINIQ